MQITKLKQKLGTTSKGGKKERSSEKKKKISIEKEKLLEIEGGRC